MSTEDRHLEPIPHPPRYPLLGNLVQFAQGGSPLQAFLNAAREHGPIIEFKMPDGAFLLVSSHALISELCDEQRFTKAVFRPQFLLRNIGGDGLFTALNDEPNWALAHRILMPAFGRRAMGRYLPDMLRVTRELVGKWTRLGPEADLDVNEDMTALTLDVIGACGFGYPFRMLQRHDEHPFIAAMMTALLETQAAAGRPPLLNDLMVGSQRRLRSARDTLFATVDDVIAARRADPALTGSKDLLSLMLTAVDPQTGQGLSDENIRYQVITFLIAGHETTSAMLAWAIHLLTQHPEIQQRAAEEALDVLGADPDSQPTLKDVHQLTYIQQILRETLRLYPPAPVISRMPRSGQQEILGGRYAMGAEQEAMILVWSLHRDPAVWGPEPERFDPDRFAPEAVQQRPFSAWLPFGIGARACIGRQFAMTEASLALAMLLRRFVLVGEPGFTPPLKIALTIKPGDLSVRAIPRVLQRPPRAVPASAAADAADAGPIPQHRTPLWVLHGSNMGTCEDLAADLADAAARRGFQVQCAPLNAHAGALPAEGATIILCATYNGHPPDSAARFVEQLDGGRFTGARYAVFGCGNSEWSATFQAIPRLIDQRLQAAGAQRLLERGEGDGRGDLDEAWEQWTAALWPALAGAFSLKPGGPEPAAATGLRVEVLPGPAASPFFAAMGARRMLVLENRELLDAAEPYRSTRHLSLKLPEGVTYRAGDHLGVIPRNPERLVQRVMARFRLDPDAMLLLHSDGAPRRHLPTGSPVPARELLSAHVELNEVATTSQIRALLANTPCPFTHRSLLALAEGGDRHREEVRIPGASLLTLLERYPACDPPLAVYLEQLSPLRPRLYSISSSPLAEPGTCTITVGVVEGPARSGEGLHQGVCSTYLRDAPVGGTIPAFVRDTGSQFRLPEDPAVPVIFIGAGTGLAPLRGFLQERMALRAQGKAPGEALLFAGSRGPAEDLYAEELAGYAGQGVVQTIYAHSRIAPDRKVYVQHRLVEHGARVQALLEQGAVVYVCGDAGAMEPAVRQALADIHAAHASADAAAAQAWLQALIAGGRYRADVWASS